MSPKSRGRPPGRGRPKTHSRGGTVRALQPADRVVQDAKRLVGSRSRLGAAALASAWLGRAWSDAPLGHREAQSDLIRAVVDRVQAKPGLAGAAAVHALRLVAPPGAQGLLDEAIDALLADFPAPAFAAEPDPEPAQAWIGSDPWGSERMLLLRYDGTEPHCLLAQVVYPGGAMVIDLKLLEADAFDRWDKLVAHRDVPIALQPAAVHDVLMELAEAIERTDITWPRQTDPDYADLRALAHTRCPEVEKSPPDWEAITDADRARLIDEFVSAGGVPDDDVTRSVADLLVDYGDGYIHGGVLAWNPEDVELFLVDWLPRKTVLDAEQRAAIPAVTRAWVGFALARRGLEQTWIDRAAAAVDENAETFVANYDDESSWGPAKHIAATLQERGIDLTDRDAVEEAVQAYNAEQLARRLLDE